MPGPAPEPAEAKRRRGSRRVDTAPERSVVRLAAVAKAPAAPDTLLAAGLEAWERIWTAAAGWLSPRTDLGIVTRYCEAIDERRALWRAIAADGPTVRGSTGQVRAHPLYGRLGVVEAHLLSLEAKLALTPADRARVGALEARPPSVLDELMTERADRRELGS